MHLHGRAGIMGGMTTNAVTATVDLYRATRLTNSANGNPRYDLHTSEGTYRTQTDASCSYTVDNALRKVRTGEDGEAIGVRVRLSMTPKRHHVWGIEVL